MAWRAQGWAAPSMPHQMRCPWRWLSGRTAWVVRSAVVPRLASPASRCTSVVAAGVRLGRLFRPSQGGGATLPCGHFGCYGGLVRQCLAYCLLVLWLPLLATLLLFQRLSRSSPRKLARLGVWLDAGCLGGLSDGACQAVVAVAALRGTCKQNTGARRTCSGGMSGVVGKKCVVCRCARRSSWFRHVSTRKLAS